jgi:hypothetical protein
MIAPALYDDSPHNVLTTAGSLYRDIYTFIRKFEREGQNL